MSTLKEEALEALSKLPDNADVDDMMYRLYVINQVHKGLEDVQNGRVTTSAELKREMETW